MSENALKQQHPWGRAVVVGGSYAGLVTARVLADFFDEVILLERDSVDEDTGTHPGAPQGYHAHAMLAKGGEILERLFPGLREELRAAGAPVFDYGESIDFLLPAGTAPRTRTGVRIQTFTRHELERRLRRRVLGMPQVTLMAGTTCTGLVRTGRGRVGGVSYRRGADPTGQTAELTADLVVDASGRTSALEDWLTALGVTVPPKRTVKAKVTYTSMNFDRPEDGHPDFFVAYQMLFAPRVPRAGVLLAVEGGRWTCSLFGFQEHPPTDDDGYLKFAHTLDNPHLAQQLLRRSEQEPTHRYTNVDNRWRPYHLVKNWPDRLVSVGDAVCVFNPVYGQGLTVAAMEAELLHAMLTRQRAAGRSLDGVARVFQRRVGRMLLAPWTLSTNSDLMWNPERQPAGARIAHWYNTRLFQVAVKDAAVWSRFVRVVNMTASPAILFHPAVAAKVLTTAARDVPRATVDTGQSLT
ncbi:FAD-dependent oxidoreductase [Streptomyces sp. NPDC101160]|uniref:FAD-dependent oxidoreductase n=1 Tax=Streptomyces sp. NPDC101160 TaxID=3366118 RepID=UPI0038200273